MKQRNQFALLGLLLAVLLQLASACSTTPSTPTLAPPGTAATEQSTYTTAAAQQTTYATAVPTVAVDVGSGDGSAAEAVATSAAARTPVPTPTPDLIERGVNEIADSIGLGETTFLGLSAGNWADLVVSVLLVAFGYFIAGSLVVRLLKLLAQNTSTKFDDQLLVEIGDVLKWLVVILFARYALKRLSFLSDSLRTGLDDILFIALLLVFTYLAIDLARFIARNYKESLKEKVDQDRLDPVITAVQRFSSFIILVIALSIGLSHFGVNTNTLFIVLLLTALIVAVGAKETIEEALAGFLILIDQPFRVGDSVLIKELNTWGDVLTIGTRSTRIRTKDNRELIIPNSKIVDSQIINYSYPDPQYRLQVDIGVAYGSDDEKMRQTITKAVRGANGVLADKPVEVLFVDWGESTRTIRVRWWIDNFHQELQMKDKVNVALESALDKAKIDMPFTTYALNVKMTESIDQPAAQQPQTLAE